MTPESFRIALFLAAFILMLTAESIFRNRSNPNRSRRIAYHLGISIVNTVLLRLVLAAPMIAVCLWAQENGIGLMNLLGAGIFEIPLTVLVYDLYNYWWHRINHEVGFFWRFHRSHHTDTGLDVTTAIRFHPVELFLSVAAKLFFIVLWGPSVWGVAFFEGLTNAFSMFHHANITLRDKAEKNLAKLFITPPIHAAHHALSVRTRDANYSTIFSFWDRLFGSFKRGEGDELLVFGVEDKKDRDTLRSFYLEPFTRR